MQRISGHPETPAVLQMRSDLAAAIKLYLMTGRVRRIDMASAMQVPDGAVADLMYGKLERFSLEDLISMANCAGLKTKISIQL